VAPAMLFLTSVLLFTTLLLCYAGYIFLIVDKRTERKIMENSELFDAIDDKTYDFEIPIEVDNYEDLRASEPTDPRELPMALLKRAMADIPRIEQLERDHPRMARLFQKGLLPFGLWEQLMEAEQLMDQEVHSVQAEAEKIKPGWGQGVFSQAYQMLRHQREEEVRAAAVEREAATLTMEFTKLSGDVVTLMADGSKIDQKSPMVVRKECLAEEVPCKSAVVASLVTGAGDEQRTYSCKMDDGFIDPEKEKQWVQIGRDSTALRLQVKFVRKTHGARAGFAVADVRVTIPAAPQVLSQSM